MGNPITEKPIPGNDCLAVFPEGETPSELQLVISDIEICVWLGSDYPVPTEGSFVIPQYNPCTYKLNQFWGFENRSFTQFFIDFGSDPHTVLIFMSKYGEVYPVLIFYGTFEGLEAECENVLVCQAPGPGIPSWEVVGGNEGSIWVGYL